MKLTGWQLVVLLLAALAGGIVLLVLASYQSSAGGAMALAGPGGALLGAVLGWFAPSPARKLKGEA